MVDEMFENEIDDEVNPCHQFRFRTPHDPCLTHVKDWLLLAGFSCLPLTAESCLQTCQLGC